MGFNFSQGSNAHVRIQLATIEAANKVYEHFNNTEYDGKKIQASYETIIDPNNRTSPNGTRI